MIKLINKVDKSINSEEALIQFSNSLKPEDWLIINGDLLEKKQFSNLEILDAYGLLLGVLTSRKRIVYIVGNHDIKALGQSFYRGATQSFFVIDNILFLHGYQFDWLNNRSRWMVNWALDALRWMEERINPHIDVDLDRILKFGRASDNDEKYIRCAIEEAIKTKVNTVVLGHTHRKKVVNRDGIYYCNSGCWVNGNRDILHMQTDNNNIYCISDLHLGNKGKADDFWTV